MHSRRGAVLMGGLRGAVLMGGRGGAILMCSCEEWS
jgi:hypothetical protein